jgi:hypothetical protein
MNLLPHPVLSAPLGPGYSGSDLHRFAEKTPTQNFFIPAGWQRVAGG